MRKTLLAFALSALFPFDTIVHAQEPAPVEPVAERVSVSCCGEESCLAQCCADPSWEVSVGALLMTRAYDNGIGLTQDLDGNPLLYANDFNGAFDLGFELKARRNQFELRYMQLNFDDRRIVDLDGLYGEFQYLSDLYSAESNYFLTSGDGPINVSTGFRYLRLNEQLNFDLAQAITIQQLRTTNNLYGWQLGVDAIIPSQNSLFKLSSFGKAGVYYVDADVQNVILPGEPSQIQMGDSEGSLAFVGEVGLKGSVQVTPWFRLDAGYQLLFLEGVALAGEQVSGLQFTPEPSVDINCGGMLYHGFVFSGTATW